MQRERTATPLARRRWSEAAWPAEVRAPSALAFATLAVLLTLVAALVASRRLAGMLTEPLSAAGLLWAAGLLGAAVFILHGLAVRARAHLPAEIGQALYWWPTLAGALLGACLWLPGTNFWALALFWGLLLAEEVAALIAFKLPSVPALIWTPRIARAPRATLPSAEAISRAPLAPEEGNELAGLEPRDDSRVEQQFVRRRDEDGGVHVEGFLRVTFAAGQRTALAHVGFCPPLPRVPQFGCEQSDGPDVRIKIAQLFAHGARLELRLAEPADEPADVLVEFHAECGGLGG